MQADATCPEPDARYTVKTHAKQVLGRARDHRDGLHVTAQVLQALAADEVPHAHAAILRTAEHNVRAGLAGATTQDNMRRGYKRRQNSEYTQKCRDELKPRDRAG